MKVNSIDIFCEIIDNFGDIGVVYRISKELKKIFQNVRIRIVLNRLCLLYTSPSPRDRG